MRQLHFLKANLYIKYSSVTFSQQISLDLATKHRPTWHSGLALSDNAIKNFTTAIIIGNLFQLHGSSITARYA